MKYESVGVTGVRERRSGWYHGMTRILSTVTLRVALPILELWLQACGSGATEGEKVPENRDLSGERRLI